MMIQNQVKTLIVLVALIFIPKGFAGVSPPKWTCPNLTDEARTLVNSARTLQGQLKDLPKCKPVEQQLSFLNDTLANELAHGKANARGEHRAQQEMASSGTSAGIGPRQRALAACLAGHLDADHLV